MVNGYYYDQLTSDNENNSSWSIITTLCHEKTSRL